MSKDKKINKIVKYIVLGAFVFSVVSVVLIMYFLNYQLKNSIELIEKNLENRLYAEGSAIKNMVSVDELQAFFVSEDTNEETYKELLRELNSYKKNHDLKSIYFMRIVDNKVEYIIDSDSKYPLGHIKETDELTLKAFSGQTTYDLVEDKEAVFKIYVPILDENNNTIAVIGVDTSEEEIIQNKNIAKKMTSISLTTTIILGLASIVVIISYRKKTKVIEEKEISKSQLLAKMSREMRTPMNAIIGFCRMAKKTTDPVKKDRYLDNINSSSNSLLELFNTILNISKVEAKKMTLDLEIVNIISLIRNIEVIIASRINKNNEKFNINISDSVQEYLYCDKNRLTEVLINIITSSLRNDPEAKEISINVSSIVEKENFCNLEFTIKDNGKELDKTVLLNMFEPFLQVQEKEVENQGLELSIAKHFIELMGGSISVTSKAEEGNTFKFNIRLGVVPQWAYPVSNVEQAIRSTEIVDCIGLVFLVAEDSQVNQIIANDLLQELGAMVEIANNGEECYEKFTANPDRYRIIFMDIGMPIMNGIEATKKIRSCGLPKAETIPIIAMTAEVFQEEIDKALNAGMTDHIGKPLDFKDMALVIKKVLKNK